MKILKKRHKRAITQTLRWSLFVMASLTMAIKIAEVSAHNTFQLIVANPEIAEYSTLVNTGYLIFR